MMSCPRNQNWLTYKVPCWDSYQIAIHHFLPLTGPLNVDKHLKVVREATWGVRAQWYDLGVELGISVGTLQVGGG